MMYTRAQRDDFESWKTEGWSADEMLEKMKKVCGMKGERRIE
jgi:hypothetical protein